MAILLSHQGKCANCNKTTEMLYRFTVDNYDYFLCTMLCCYKFKNKKKINERAVRMSALIRR